MIDKLEDLARAIGAGIAAAILTVAALSIARSLVLLGLWIGGRVGPC